MTDPTNPGDIPDPGAIPPPPPPPPAEPSGGFPPPASGTAFPPPTLPTQPTQPTPMVGDPLGPPPGPPASKGKGPLIAVLAVAAVLLGVGGFLAFGGNEDDKTDDAASAPTTTEAEADSTTTTENDGPGGKEGAADGGDKEEQPGDTSADDAQGYGDDPVLDVLYDQCETGDFQACDTLYLESDFGSEYEAFGDTCGDRNEPAGYCVDLYADGGNDGGSTDSIDGSGATSYGDNAQLDALYDQCEAGDFEACDTLYAESDFGSEYEEFGDTCGDRNEPAGYCVDVYADDGG